MGTLISHMLSWHPLTKLESLCKKTDKFNNLIRCTKAHKYQILYTIILLSIFKENGQGLQQFGCKIPQIIPNLARHASFDYSLFPKAKILHTFQN